mmetsp:Transcript_38068/g.80608  ORF Transcript_38068/g.80608 Transcript_38068/m.80608 type:complete len:100 (+) Transcript_38068:2489-2788(+)
MSSSVCHATPERVRGLFRSVLRNDGTSLQQQRYSATPAAKAAHIGGARLRFTQGVGGSSVLSGRGRSSHPFCSFRDSFLFLSIFLSSSLLFTGGIPFCF